MVEYSALIKKLQDLEKATEDADLSLVCKYADEFAEHGRNLVVSYITNQPVSNPHVIARRLVEVLSHKNWQGADTVRHSLAKSARLFIEIMCQDFKAKKVKTDESCVSDMASRIDKVLKSINREQVGLHYALTCSQEALKLITDPQSISSIVKIVDLNLQIISSSASGSLSLAPVIELARTAKELYKNKKRHWYQEAFYIYWVRTSARTNNDVFNTVRDNIKEHLQEKEIALTGVEFFGDLVLNGELEIATKALVEEPGLISLANLTKKRSPLSLAKKHTPRWAVRHLSAEFLSDAAQRLEGGIGNLSWEALEKRAGLEDDNDVKTLLCKIFCKHCKLMQHRVDGSNRSVNSLQNSLAVTEPEKQILNTPLIKKIQEVLKTPKPSKAPINPILTRSFLDMYVFGVEKWNKYFGDVGVEPALPRDIVNDLMEERSPFDKEVRVKEFDLLFFLPEKVNGKALTYSYLKQLVRNPKDTGISVDLDLQQGLDLDVAVKGSRWVFLTRGVVTYRDNREHYFQENGYQQPHWLDAAICISMMKVDGRRYRYGDFVIGCEETKDVNTFMCCFPETRRVAVQGYTTNSRFTIGMRKDGRDLEMIGLKELSRNM